MDASDLKYREAISGFAECPPAGAEGQDREACRFVFGDINDQRNFLPVALISPSRTFDGSHARCISHALSLWTTRETALEFYRQKAKGYRRFKKTIGTHLASGRIAADDGLATRPAASGHFSFFEASQVELKSKFQIIEPLP
jgi:hypothetical protein